MENITPVKSLHEVVDKDCIIMEMVPEILTKDCK